MNIKHFIKTKMVDKIRNKRVQKAYIQGQLSNLKYNYTKKNLEDKILNCEKSGVTSEKYCEHELIVSLTTYGKRLQDVCFTIESLMHQTLPPNRIILNIALSYQQKPLPLTLKKQITRGLEIAYVEDTRSYKKLIPTLRDNPNAIIITVDDDVLYEFDLIERLFNSYLDNPNKVSALRTHTIIVDKNGKPLNYNKWKWGVDEAKNSFQLFATGVGGILYPPHCLSEEVFNQEIFTSICPTADDVWFHAMALKNGTRIIKVPTRSADGCDYIMNEDVQDIGLCNINVGQEGHNDIQIKAVYERYGIYDILKQQ